VGGSLLGTESHVIDYIVSGDDRWMSVSQFETTDTVRQILERRRNSDIVVETPIQINANGSLRVTYLGSESELQSLFQQVSTDTDLSFEVLETGTYEPDDASLTRLLTARQQEVLEAAVRVGYYSAPRDGTHQDVAEDVGIAPTTAGEHLRKIEERVFETLVY
jgi:predicted DNA binding protein